jgi:hypothetical protein
LIKLELDGQSIEPVERDYFEHLIGLAYSTCSLCNLFGNPLLVKDFEESLATRHARDLKRTIQPLKDRELAGLFLDLENQFIEVQSLNNQVVDMLANMVDLPSPKSAEAYATLLEKLDTSLGDNWFPSLFSDLEFKPFLDSSIEKFEKMSQVKIQIVKRILVLYPELARSELIDSRDRLLLKIT